MKPAKTMTLFVYGTLKRGSWNHHRFCTGVLEIKEAAVRGRLYEAPSGIPVLEVPEEDIFAHGTSDPRADLKTQTAFSEQAASHPGSVPDRTSPQAVSLVQGELVVFDDPSRRLPAIDGLEGFRPGKSSPYQRVLAPVFTEGRIQPAWLYRGSSFDPKYRLLPSGVWPP